MRVGVTGKLVVKMNIPVAVRNATTLTYYVQEVAQHSATPPFVLAAKWKTCSMLNVVWPYMGSGQWTAKVKPRLVAC